jgi:hypothetical protein
MVIGFYFGMQFLCATLTNRPLDITNTLLAVLACGFALRIERWLASLDGLSIPESLPLPAPATASLRTMDATEMSIDSSSAIP